VETQNTSRAPWWRTILIGRNPVHTFTRIVILVVACVVLRLYVFWPIRVQGPSMSPTYRDNQINVVNHLAYATRPPQRGDVVAIRTTGPQILLLKRIIAMPGETVEFISGKVFINGAPLDEPYVKHDCFWDMPPRRLIEDEYFVVGDNRSMNIALHDHGVASRERIMGKILL
jgi:signal peptidase I